MDSKTARKIQPTQRLAFKKPMELSALCARSRNEMLNISPAAKPCMQYEQYMEHEQLDNHYYLPKRQIINNLKEESWWPGGGRAS